MNISAQTLSRWLAFLALGSVLALPSMLAQTTKPSGTQGKPASSAPPSKSAAPSPATQTPATPGQTESKTAEPNPASVPASAAVITIDGLCEAGSSASTPVASGGSPNCTTKVTKADFEKLVEALNPDMPAQARSGLADAYTKMLIMSVTAQKRGLDKLPGTDELLHFARLQALATVLNQNISKRAQDVPQQEVQAAYDKDKSKYEEVTLERLYIPKMLADKKLDAAKQKALADQIRTRAAAGEDFEKLEKEIYADAEKAAPASTQPGQSAPPPLTPPPTNMGVRRHGGLPADQEEAVWKLDSGQVSQVFENNYGYYIYKVDSKKTLPLSDVQREIKQSLEQQRYRDAMQEVFANLKIDLNPTYFGQSTITLPGAAPTRPAPPRVGPAASAAPSPTPGPK